jgi:SulP family sulfate permease
VLAERLRASGRTLIICGARQQPAAFLAQGAFVAHVGERNIAPHVQAALARANEIRAEWPDRVA